MANEMKIPCSSCGRTVRVRVNDNGEVNCPHCGAGLLVLPSSDGSEFADPPQTLDPEGILTTSRTLSPAVFAAGLVVVVLLFVGLFFWLR